MDMNSTLDGILRSNQKQIDVNADGALEEE